MERKNTPTHTEHHIPRRIPPSPPARGSHRTLTARLAPAALAALIALAPAPAPAQSPAPPAPPNESLADINAKCITFLLEHQEGEPRSQWPYEGVYRVGGSIPIGYRVGGTSIVAMALLDAPGYAQDQARRDAVARAFDYVLAAAEHPLMSADYDGGYDVRGWGFTYGLTFALKLKQLDAFPSEKEEAGEAFIRLNINALQRTAIRDVGGWNYARPSGQDTVAPPSPFMTAPTIEALLAAKAAGYPVDQATLEKAVETLIRAKTAAGGIVYSGAASDRSRDAVPGAVGRMLATEVALHKAGRGSIPAVRGAVDAFFTHWSWLDQRRAKTGTHQGPYGVAPYYFYFAHRYAASAIELLPDSEKPEYRRRLRSLLFSVRREDGTWNDRVFDRSAAYGTAMVLMALNELEPQPR